jgi:hypothetical protein
MKKNRIISVLYMMLLPSCITYAQTSGSSDNVYKKLLEAIENKQNNLALNDFRKKFTFKNFLALLGNYDNVNIAKRCGFEFVYKDVEIDGEIECIEIVYGYDVKKGRKKDFGYEIIPKSEHACYLTYNLDGSTGASLHFKDLTDVQTFQEQAKEYGLVISGDSYWVPKKKISSGYHSMNGQNYEFIYGIGGVKYYNGWYFIPIGIDF